MIYFWLRLSVFQELELFFCSSCLNATHFAESVFRVLVKRTLEPENENSKFKASRGQTVVLGLGWTKPGWASLGFVIKKESWGTKHKIVNLDPQEELRMVLSEAVKYMSVCEAGERRICLARCWRAVAVLRGVSRVRAAACLCPWPPFWSIWLRDQF